MNRPNTYSSLAVFLRATSVMVVSLTLLAGCSSNDGNSAQGREATTTVAIGRRAEAPLGKVELPPLEFTPVDDSGTLQAELTAEALFDFDSSQLKPAGDQVVEQISQKLQVAPAWVRVDGFTDGKGSESHNLKLSQQRAEAVASKIKALGTAQGVQACGLGEQGSDGDSDDPAQRRVVVTISVKPLDQGC